LASAKHEEIRAKTLPNQELKLASLNPAEIRASALSSPQPKLTSATLEEIRAKALPNPDPRLASSNPAEIRTRALSSLVPKLQLGPQDMLKKAKSESIAPSSNLEPAPEQSYASNAGHHPGIRQERDFSPAQPEVHITIGTIEVRADSKPDKQPVELPPANPESFGFDEYAQIRRYLSWER